MEEPVSRFGDRAPGAAPAALALLAAGCAPSAAGPAATSSGPSVLVGAGSTSGSAAATRPEVRGSVAPGALPRLAVPEGWTSVHVDTAHGRYTAAGPARLSAQGCEAGARLEGRLYWQRRGATEAEPPSLGLAEVWPLDLQVAAFEAASEATSGAAPRQGLALLAHGQTGAERVELRLTVELGHDDDRHEVALWALLPAEVAPGSAAPRPLWAGRGPSTREHLGVCRSGHEAEWARDPKGRPSLRRAGFAEVIDSAEEENSQTPSFAVARATCRAPADEWIAVP